MKRSTILTGVLVVAVGSLGYAFAQGSGVSRHLGSGHRMSRSTGGMMGAGGTRGSGQGGRMGQGGTNNGNGNMRRHNPAQSGNASAMPRNMRMRGMMMYNLQANPDDPAGALALKNQLQLTPGQVQKIQQIAQQARRQTQQVLTGKQRQTLKPLKNTPNTFMGMYNRMLQWMMTHRQGRMKGAGQHMTGRSQGMMGGRSGSGSGGMRGRGMMGRGGRGGNGMGGSPWMNMMQWQFGSPDAQSNVSSKDAASKQPNDIFTLSTGANNGRLAFIGAGRADQGKDNPTLHVKRGDLVKIVLENGDGVVHNIVIPAFQASSANVSVKGSRTTLLFRADRAGTFTYYCAIPGHRQLGMEGKLIVAR